MFKSYLDFLKDNYPLYMQNMQSEELENMERLYYLINDVYISSSFFNRDEYLTRNFYNLMKEYRTYYSRILLLIPLNDKYLIDALIRLLIEKLYRIIYGSYHLHLEEGSIRRHERRKMSERLETFDVKDKELLDTLYNDYSKLIHHTDSTETDLLNFKQLTKIDVALIDYVIEVVEKLNLIYIKNVFVIIINEGNLDLASNLTLKDVMQENFKDILKEEGITV